jgi:plastocyanin
MKRTAALLVAGVIAAVGLAACGDDSNDDSTAADTAGSSSVADTGASAAAQTLEFPTDPTALEFTTPKNVPAKAGTTTFVLDNKSDIEHTLEIKGPDGEEIGEVPEMGKGTGEFTADLAPGTYTYVCDLPGHEATMNGTITVK